MRRCAEVSSGCWLWEAALSLPKDNCKEGLRGVFLLRTSSSKIKSCWKNTLIDCNYFIELLSHMLHSKYCYFLYVLFSNKELFLPLLIVRTVVVNYLEKKKTTKLLPSPGDLLSTSDCISLKSLMPCLFRSFTEDCSF